MITADHGCDPDFTKTTDHTRECVPLIVYGKKINPENLGIINGFTYISTLVYQYLGVDYD